MATLTAKEFIQKVLIDELGSMIKTHPYMSFIIMSIGIEFLGKCINRGRVDWNLGGRPTVDFEKAINDIPNFERYRIYLTTHDLYDSLRCGLAHSVAPKGKVTLSSKEEAPHLTVFGNSVNLKVEDFYKDFKEACEYVIIQTYSETDKMNGAFLYVPGETFNAGTTIVTGITSSYSSSGSTSTYPAASGTIPPLTDL